MSWSELEQFVKELEADATLRRALKHCRYRKELILAAWRLGYRSRASIYAQHAIWNLLHGPNPVISSPVRMGSLSRGRVF